MVIKKNPYSDRVIRGLQAVSELTAPDYVVCPVDPTATMAAAGARAAKISQAKARQVYLAMVHAWALQAPPAVND